MSTHLQIFHYAQMTFQLASRHRYPLPRYIRLYEATIASQFVNKQLVQPGYRATDMELRLAHSERYLRKITRGDLNRAELRQLNLPWSEPMVNRARHIVGATNMAANAAAQNGVAFVLGGGTHHAHADFGSGFCVFNDIVVAARNLQQQNLAKRIAVIDCDVHQGDGTAAITQNDSSIFTLSIHAAHNFPFTKATSNLDIALEDDCSDEAYLRAIRRSTTHVIRQIKPELIFYIAGADPYVEDRIGRLAITPTGLANRDRLVLNACYRAGIPVAVLMGGGYARQIEKTVALNMKTIEIASTIFRQPFGAVAR